MRPTLKFDFLIWPLKKKKSGHPCFIGLAPGCCDCGQRKRRGTRLIVFQPFSLFFVRNFLEKIVFSRKPIQMMIEKNVKTKEKLP